MNFTNSLTLGIFYKGVWSDSDLLVFELRFLLKCHRKVKLTLAKLKLTAVNVSTTYQRTSLEQKTKKNTLLLLIINKTNQRYNLSKESLELWERAKEEITSWLLLLRLNGIN